MGYSNVFVLVYPDGYIQDTVYGPTFQSSKPLFMNIDIDHHESLLEFKNLILRNMGELGRKQISQMAYRLHVIIGCQSECQVLWLNSDKDIQLMFDYHDSNKELRCIELYVKVEDVISSATSKASPQVVRWDNIGRGTKRVLSPVIPPSYAFPNRAENVKVVDGKRSNICASPANMTSKGVAVDKLCLPLKTTNTGGACGVFTPPTSKKPDTGANLGFLPPPKMQKLVGGNGKPTETGVLVPDIEESNVYSNHFQAKGMSRNLEPPVIPSSQTALEGRVKEMEILLESKENQVKEFEIRLESKENERAALEELKVTLTSKISNLENKLKEANKEKASQLRKEKKVSKERIEQLEAEVNHLDCNMIAAKERTRWNIVEQVRLLAPGIDFSRVHPDNQVVNGGIVNPKKKDPEPQFTLQIGGKGQAHPMLHAWPQAKDRAQGNLMDQE